MKTTFLIISLFVGPCIAVRAGTAEEKAFTDKYKSAFETKDAATLHSFLHTQGADPGIVEFFKMMQTGEIGGKVSKIELVDLSPEDVKKAAAPQDSPGGEKVCLTLKPSKKLVYSIEQKNSQGSSTSTTENMVAEKDGKFVIPVPSPCK